MAGCVYRAGGEVMADRGRLRGVADEGGWWPEFASNAEALDTLVEAIERATQRPGEEIFSAKFTDAPLAEGKFETYLHERENAKKPHAVRLSRPQLPMVNCSAADAPD
jgi:enolase